MHARAARLDHTAQPGRISRSARCVAISVIALSLNPLTGGVSLAWFTGFTLPERTLASISTVRPEDETLPEIVAARLEEPPSIRVDGRLDDAAWRAVEPGGDFRAWDPDRGAGGHV
ncbi:MAG: hypothetical protein FJY88_04665 [Candidatus Eisenbacteria bacterium]|nr:hypothetical protein [Candidatus Eisenbacteria bacterium]